VTDRPNSPAELSEVVIAIFVTGAAERWAPTLVSLRTGCPEHRIVAGGPQAPALEELRALGERYGLALETRAASDAGELIEIAAHDLENDVLLVAAPVVVPPGFLETAIRLAGDDLRCASVSFFSNAAGYLSFPACNTPALDLTADVDEAAMTRRLRRRSRALAPIPIPYAAGPAVLLTRQGLSLAWPPPRNAQVRIDLMLYDHSARARTHGIVDYLDASTFITRPRDALEDLSGGSALSSGDTETLGAPSRALLLQPTERAEYDAGLGDVFRAARAAVLGLRVIVDGTCLGASETGLQVSILALIAALATRPDIAYLGVAIPRRLQPYAAERLSAANVDVRVAPEGDFTVFPHSDIVHRPFQPGHGMRQETWRQVGHRTLVTIHDLIAYQVPGYHDSPAAWFAYRTITRDACREVDAVIAISGDVGRAIAGERLPVDAERIFVVPNGINHLRGDEPEVMPGELLHRGFAGEEFLLVLGADYSHKNRDLAVRTLGELTARGHSLALVMAGTHVPCGSSRAAEAASWTPGLPVFAIPDVTSAERNWLLRHASVVLYPTSAEGFGLIPEEAAAWGTPTLFVPFGPLGDRHPRLPVSPATWSPGAFADAVEELLADPSLGAAQVAAIAEGAAAYDWTVAADATVDAYWAVLGRPARAGQTRPRCEDGET